MFGIAFSGIFNGITVSNKKVPKGSGQGTQTGWSSWSFTKKFSFQRIFIADQEDENKRAFPTSHTNSMKLFSGFLAVQYVFLQMLLLGWAQETSQSIMAGKVYFPLGIMGAFYCFSQSEQMRSTGLTFTANNATFGHSVDVSQCLVAWTLHENIWNVGIIKVSFKWWNRQFLS